MTTLQFFAGDGFKGRLRLSNSKAKGQKARSLPSDFLKRPLGGRLSAISPLTSPHDIVGQTQSASFMHIENNFRRSIIEFI